MPPAPPPMLDDVLSQVSQRGLSSTQLFRSNSEHFDKVKDKFFTEKLVGLSPFNDINHFPNSVHAGQQFSQNEHKNLSGVSQLVHLQSPPFIDDDDDYTYEDEKVIQDSPELFSQVMEAGCGTKFEGKRACDW